MKHLLSALLVCTAVSWVPAQKKVSISGQIDNLASDQTLYLGIGKTMRPLTLSPDRTFSVDVSTRETPSFLFLAQLSKRGKVEKQTPMVWFASDRVTIRMDWATKKIQTSESMPFQALSEQVEALSGRPQLDFILAHPESFSSVYFAEQQKDKMSIAELEEFSQKIDPEYRSSSYAKRIESYLAAKKLGIVKKGDKVTDFLLPDSAGKPVSVLGANGRPTLIALFSSGCSFSIASIDLLEQVARLNDNEVNLITIWEDENKETWLEDHADKKAKITWTNLWDETGFADTYLNLTMLPTFYVVDKDRVVTDIITGYTGSTAKKLKALVE
ncbi:MAG: TlpA family protein disulfide reductase [Cyclobacteriaceae bacterium]|jgi:hypothetical protein|nr:TlpA family protein disulfide reductase [Cyclobacteriaceae bacterium]